MENIVTLVWVILLDTAAQYVAIDSSGQAGTSCDKDTIRSSSLTKEGDYREYKADVITQDSRHCSRHGCIQDPGESRVISRDRSFLDPMILTILFFDFVEYLFGSIFECTSIICNEMYDFNFDDDSQLSWW